MANNYLLFSEILPAMTDEETKWTDRVLSCNPDGDQVEATRTILAEAGIGVDADILDAWPDFQWELDPSRSELWLYAEECGNVCNVCEFVRAFLARFRPTACWHLTWATTCSKPRVGEFGGGGAFVTASRVKFYSPDDSIARERKKFERAAKTRGSVARS